MNDIRVPEFSREDYLLTVKAFEWVDSFSDSELQIEQIMTLVSLQAEKVGVKNFKTMYKKHLKDIAKNNNDLTLYNATNFEGQKLQLACGLWDCDDMGVSIKGPTGDEVACMHPIMPVQRLINIDTNIVKLKIDFKICDIWKNIIVDRKTLASNTSIISLADYGIAVNSTNSNLLVRFLTEIECMNQGRIPELNSVGRLGWIPEHGFSPYVDNLVFDGDATFKHFFDSVKEKGSFDKWLEVAEVVRNGNSIPARIMLAASFASVLVEICGGLPFFVHLWGNTEGGKTVALMLAASVWANPRPGSYLHSFNGTGVAQELSAGFVNSLPLILDELQIMKDKKDFDQMIYQLTEGVGRQRGAKTGGLQQTKTWSNCILTSGEMPLSGSNSGGGAVNRIIDLEYNEALFENPVYVAETVKKNYGFAGKRFIDCISDDEVQDRIIQKNKEFLKVLQQSESTDKQAMSASIILTADFFATEFIFKDGMNLSVEDITPFLTTKTDVSQNVRAYEYIMDIIAMNESRFSSYAGDSTERWGVTDDGYIYIITTKFRNILRDEGYNSTAVLSWLRKNNLIECEGNRVDKVKKIGGMSRRCVWLKQSALDTFVEEISVESEKNPFIQEKLEINV